MKRRTSRKRTSLRRNSQRSIHVTSTAGRYRMNRLSGQDYYTLGDNIIRMVQQASGYEHQKDSDQSRSWREARIDALAALMAEAMMDGSATSLEDKRLAMIIATSVHDQFEGRT